MSRRMSADDDAADVIPARRMDVREHARMLGASDVLFGALSAGLTSSLQVREALTQHFQQFEEVWGPARLFYEVWDRPRSRHPQATTRTMQELNDFLAEEDRFHVRQAVLRAAYDQSGVSVRVMLAGSFSSRSGIVLKGPFHTRRERKLLRWRCRQSCEAEARLLRRPWASQGIAFGLSIAAGVIAGLLLERWLFP